jgi:hypothetical protein
MKFAVFSWPEHGSKVARASLDEIEAGGGLWARFGRDLLVLAPAAKWRAFVDGLGDPARGGAEVRREGVLKAKPHLVVQKGRGFQRDHNDVRVILDKGRHLVVEATPAKARAISKRGEGCYHIEPLGENRVVLAERPRTARLAAPDPDVAATVARLSQPDFEVALARLVSIPTRHSTSPGYAEAAEWMRGELAALGLATRLEPIDVNGGPSVNLVAFKSGIGVNDRRHVLVTAHLDSINHEDGLEATAPGADDNASGSAGVLTLARALASVSFRDDISFLLFGGEEQGLLGSRQYIASLPEAERARIRAVLNMDMIGTLNAQLATVLLEGAPLSQGMIDGLAMAAAAFTGLLVQTSLDPHDSDHESFIEKTIPAVLTIEGGDDANDAVHSARDTLERVDPVFAMEILRMNAGYLAMEAGIEAKVDRACEPAWLGDPAKAALGALAGHYQALFAQYARLRRDGVAEPADLADWRAAWRACESLFDGS